MCSQGRWFSHMCPPPLDRFQNQLPQVTPSSLKCTMAVKPSFSIMFFFASISASVPKSSTHLAITSGVQYIYKLGQKSRHSRQASASCGHGLVGSFAPVASGCDGSEPMRCNSGTRTKAVLQQRWGKGSDRDSFVFRLSPAAPPQPRYPFRLRLLAMCVSLCCSMRT